MPLTEKGSKIMKAMASEYGAKKGKAVFYASRNAGRITGVDPQSSMKHIGSKAHSARNAGSKRLFGK